MPDLSPYLSELINVILLAVITYLAERIHRIKTELHHNTDLTERVAHDVNGERRRLQDELADARNDATKLRMLLDAYRNIVNYVRSHPDGKTILDQFAERRRVAMHDEYLAQLERRLLDQSGDRP